jgi:hypothetical protein
MISPFGVTIYMTSKQHRIAKEEFIYITIWYSVQFANSWLKYSVFSQKSDFGKTLLDAMETEFQL